MRLEDGVLTKLEIASVQLIFDESFASTDKSLISVLPVNLLKYSAALLIIDIYQFSPDQRQFILNELVMNFLRLPIKKSEVKNCQIERGNSIQLFTMICVRLSQQNAASSLSAELIKRVSEKYNSNSKTILEYLIEDLTSLLVYPEWSASAELLNCLSANLLQTVRSQNCPPLVEVYFLEVLGNICGKILILKNDPQVDIMTQAEALTEVQKYSSPTGTEEYLQSLFKDEQEDSTASYASVVLKELNKFCTIFLNSLGNFLDSPKIKMKTKAIKILSSLSDKHASLLSSPTLQQALSARLCDDATSVRDAVYEFIGNYIRSHPDEADNFYNPICNALGDDGISVRKKAIKLTRQVYSLFSTNAKILIGSRLLKRLNDEEDSVKNESVSVMTDCWIAPLKNGTLINLGMSHHKTMESLEFFLQFHILNNAKLSDAVNGLIEILLDIISGALLLLSACTKCKRDLLGQDKLIALQPLILDETNCNKKSYRYVLRILKNVLPSVSSLRPDFINPVQEFLFSKLTKMSHRELHEAIPSLWQLCKIKQNYLKMVNATISTLKMLKKYIDDKQLLDNRVGKLIQLLACLVKYCELESYQEYFFKANIGLKKNESVISLVVKYIISFCQESGHVQTVAVTNLIVVCANHPRILMSPPVLSLFDSALQTTPETIRAVTQEMIDFLNEKDQESINTNKSNLEDIIDDACPGIVQRYISRMLALSLKDKGEYGYLPFQFVQVALQLGFANPKVCISTIIALEASPVSIISSTAISIHKDLFDKHESLVDTNYQEGIKHAFESDLVNVSFLNIVHGIVEGTRGARNKFIQAMLKVLDLNDICLVLFLAERISYIKFKSTEEILMILRRLQDIVHTSNVTDDMDHQVALSTYTIIELYRHLQTVYKVTDEQVELFGSGDLEIDHKHPPKVFKSVTLNLDWIRNNIDNKESTQECIKHIEAFI
ncbi:SCC2 Sister chromatid cohesion protein 2 [Candida maltosa Xu316]